jgi:ABC-type nitrate/sulfonate/bicarbonate transport system substrate-binding protein
MHHYLLRDWLAAGGIDPDRDVSLRIFPPGQLARHIERGYVDGFCVGEPWNTLAQRNGAGRIVTLTNDFFPAHPEKVLAVTRKWARSRESVLLPMIRAILRGCAVCDDASNVEYLAELLGRPEYLNADTDAIRQSLGLRGFAATATFPSKTHAAWMASQMIRWAQLPETTEVLAIVNHCADPTAYRAAAASFGLACPASNFPPMALRNGVFDPARVGSAAAAAASALPPLSRDEPILAEAM